MLVSGTRLFVSSLFFLFVTNPVWADPGPKPPSVQPNDNRRSAGTLVEGTLTLKLRAAVGVWSPEGETGPALRVEAFGEESGPLTAPSPLIRVPEGTEIVASVRNDLDAPLRVHGLCARDGAPCAPVEVPAVAQPRRTLQGGTRRDLSLLGDDDRHAACSFARQQTRSCQARSSSIRRLRRQDDDRVLVITDWTSLTPRELRDIAAADDPGVAFLKLDPRSCS